MPSARVPGSRWHYYSLLYRRWVLIVPVGGVGVQTWARLLKKYDFYVALR